MVHWHQATISTFYRPFQTKTGHFYGNRGTVTVGYYDNVSVMPEIRAGGVESLGLGHESEAA